MRCLLRFVNARCVGQRPLGWLSRNYKSHSCQLDSASADCCRLPGVGYELPCFSPPCPLPRFHLQGEDGRGLPSEADVRSWDRVMWSPNKKVKGLQSTLPQLSKKGRFRPRTFGLLARLRASSCWVGWLGGGGEERGEERRSNRATGETMKGPQRRSSVQEGGRLAQDQAVRGAGHIEEGAARPRGGAPLLGVGRGRGRELVCLWRQGSAGGERGFAGRIYQLAGPWTGVISFSFASHCPFL